MRDLIRRWFGIGLSLVTIGKYLHSWGLSPQQPIRKTHEQNGGALRKDIRRRPAVPKAPTMPHLPAPPARPDLPDLHLDVGQLDPSGRVSARPLLHQLGWPPGHRMQFDIAHRAITATSHPTGRHTIGATGRLAVPAAIRQLCHLAAGDVVVLLADPGRDLLLIHPARTVARLLADQFAAADGG